MKRKLLGLLIAVLLLTIVFSGCVEENTVTAEEIKERFLQASNSVTFYRYIANGAMTRVTTNDSGTTVTMEAPYSMNCNVDITDKKMNMDMTINVTGGGEMYSGAIGEMNMNYYFEGDTMYTNAYGDNLTWTTWGGGNIWYSYAMLERQTHFILNSSTVERLNDETVDGTDCYVLNVTPIISELQLTKSSTDFLFPQGYSPEKFLEVVIKYWINKDTNLLKKAYIKTLTNVTMSGSSFGKNITKDLLLHETEMTFYDYNMPFTVEPPWQNYINLAEETLSHLKYINITYGYGFNPPNGWVKDDFYGDQFGVSFNPPIEGKSNYNWSFSVRPPIKDIFNQDNGNLSYEVVRLLEYYNNVSTKNVTLISHSERTINGMDAHEFVVSSTYYGIWKIKTVYVEKGDRLFKLEFKTPPEDYDSYGSVVNESIDSFMMISPYYQINLW